MERSSRPRCQEQPWLGILLRATISRLVTTRASDPFMPPLQLVCENQDTFLNASPDPFSVALV